MNVGQHRLQLGDIEPGAGAAVDLKVAAGDFPAEGESLQIEKTRRALQVGKPLSRQGRQALEFGPARHAEAKHVEQIGIVLLEHPEERGDVARDVVDRLEPWSGLPAKEDAAHTDERFGIAIMLGAVDQSADPAGQIAFAAQVTGGGRDGANPGAGGG